LQAEEKDMDLSLLSNVPYWEREKFVRIRIQDNGIGFDPAYAEKIFEIFQRLHSRSYSGTGIGLAICKKIVDNHHGLIHAESKDGEGALFTIILPLSQKKYLTLPSALTSDEKLLLN
jgi:signal transduction histidine kinase